MFRAAVAQVLLTVLIAGAPCSAMVLGNNGWYIADWGGNLYLKDLTPLDSRAFHVLMDGDNRDYPHGPGDPMSDHPELELDENRYPLELPSQGIRAVVKLYLTNFADHGLPYPKGTYTILFDGTGEVKVRLGTDLPDVTIEGTGGETRHEIEVQSLSPYLNVRITRSQRGDHIRNLRLIMPDQSGGTSYVDNYMTDPYNPLFLEDLRPFGVMRHMTDAAVATSDDVHEGTWEYRSLKYGTCQSQRGMAYEWMIDMANRMNMDVWICVPHKATVDFNTKLAQLVKEQLKPELKVYIEWSNEVWNGMLPYSIAQQYASGLGGGNWQKGQAIASASLFSAFESVFGDESNRVINVISGQSVSPGTASGIISFMHDASVNPNGTKVEAVGMAPYMHGIDIGTLRASIGRNAGDAQAYRGIADGEGAMLVCYEGGQSITSGNKGQEANESPEIKSVYTEYLDALAPYVDVFVHYTLYGECADPGCWGSKKNPFATSAPKLESMWDWAQSKGQLRDVPSVAVDRPAGRSVFAHGAASSSGMHGFVTVGRDISLGALMSGRNPATVSDLFGRRVVSPESGSGGATDGNLPHGIYLISR